MSYSDKVIDHYNNPRNVGSMDKSSADVGTGLVGAPECGDVMKLQIKVDEASGAMAWGWVVRTSCHNPLRNGSQKVLPQNHVARR